MVRSARRLLWSLSACLPMALTAHADDQVPAPATPAPAVAPEASSEAPPVPQAVPATPESTPAAAKAPESELIQERYPNRAVKISRHVVQDASGNYVNHGKWTMYDEKGRLLGSGEYHYGERHGLWTRWHLTASQEMLAQAPYKQFQAPFVSEATFDNGRLHGSWTIYDNQDRKCSEFVFENGEREGKSTWYYPTGAKMREIDYTGGQIDGQWQEWGADKRVTMNDSYQSGRRLAKRSETYPGGQTKSEGTYLFAREVLTSTYDWWNGTITTTHEKEGKDQRHGSYTTWFKNGQKEQEGEYVNDLPVGKSQWWYENGQKASEGQFANGERDGLWTWWHQNGQKAASGEFVKGTEIGKWTWWKEDGKVANSARITEGATKVVIDISTPNESTISEPPKPAPAKPAARQARTQRRAPSTTTRR